MAQEADGLAIAVQGSNVDVALSGAHSDGLTTSREPRIDQGTDVFFTSSARVPELIQLVEYAPRHAKRPPDPVRARMHGLDLNLQHLARRVRLHGIEELRALDGKEQESEAIIRQLGQGVGGEPDRIRQAYRDILLGADDHAGPENGVTKTGGVGLYDVGDVGAADPAPVVLQDVGFTG